MWGGGKLSNFYHCKLIKIKFFFFPQLVSIVKVLLFGVFCLDFAIYLFIYFSCSLVVCYLFIYSILCKWVIKLFGDYTSSSRNMVRFYAQKHGGPWGNVIHDFSKFY